MLSVPSLPTGLLTLAFAWFLLSLTTCANSYFVINQPIPGDQWLNNAINPITWEKGLLDGLEVVDIELSRMSEDGIIFVAQNIPASSSQGALNLYLQDVPPGDDYYLVFLNYTHGVMYCASQRFSISNSSGNGSAPSPTSDAPTVTVSGGPNPTVGFATIFSSNGGAAVLFSDGARTQMRVLVGTMVVCLLGAWTVL